MRDSTNHHARSRTRDWWCRTARGLTVLAIAMASALHGAAAQGNAPAIAPDPRYAEVARALSAFIERERLDKGIPAISIALVDDQRTVWARGVG